MSFRGEAEESAALESTKHYHVYIVSNKSKRLYTGITSNLRKRVFQHKHKLLDGFTARYNFDMLGYYETFAQVVNAITREKQIKSWRREKKLRLILAKNPHCQDLNLRWEGFLLGYGARGLIPARFEEEHFGIAIGSAEQIPRLRLGMTSQ